MSYIFYITIRMDKTITVLTWFAMATLALGIARQLSEQKFLHAQF